MYVTVNNAETEDTFKPADKCRWNKSVKFSQHFMSCRNDRC